MSTSLHFDIGLPVESELSKYNLSVYQDDVDSKFLCYNNQDIIPILNENLEDCLILTAKGNKIQEVIKILVEEFGGRFITDDELELIIYGEIEESEAFNYSMDTYYYKSK
jgi:hypothetical protein